MVNINGKKWKIVLTSPTHPALVRNDGTYTIGSCDNDTKTIYINRNLSTYMTKKVLCHELVHALIFSYNVKLTLLEEEALADFVAKVIIGETN